MGMFDEIICKMPLPIGNAAEYQDRKWQTKDTPAQFLDNYEIREDGTLWHEQYDIEDHSDKTKEGWEGIIGCMRVNLHWCQMGKFSGELRFYGFKSGSAGWIEFSAYFMAGKMKELNLFVERNE